MSWSNCSSRSESTPAVSKSTSKANNSIVIVPGINTFHADITVRRADDDDDDTTSSGSVLPYSFYDVIFK